MLLSCHAWVKPDKNIPKPSRVFVYELSVVSLNPVAVNYKIPPKITSKIACKNHYFPFGQISIQILLDIGAFLD